MVGSLNIFLEETMLSKRLRSRLLTPGIQIALSQQGRGITCKLYCLPSALSLDFDYTYTKWATLANEEKVYAKSHIVRYLICNRHL